jgi:hypothetical protein
LPAHRALSRSPTLRARGLSSDDPMHTMINGNTELIAHIGYPTHAFKAPMIYNPYFDHIGVNARVMPMGCRSEDYPPSCARCSRSPTSAAR